MMLMRAHPAKVLATLALVAWAVPAGSAHADATGGASAGSPPAQAPAAPPGDPHAAPAGAGSLAVPSAAWLGRTVRFAGRVGPGAAGRTVRIERFNIAKGAWVPTAEARTDDQGAFAATWRTNETGHFTVRARPDSAQANSAQADSDAVTARLTVYRPAVATWYGPHFFNHRTACGQRMTPQLLGVASRTLPCGTQVEISYRGRAITVPVVDRGPYSSASWDLTAATARALSFSGRQRIGTLLAGRAPSGPTTPGQAPKPGGPRPSSPGPSAGAGSAVGGASPG